MTPAIYLPPNEADADAERRVPANIRRAESAKVKLFHHGQASAARVLTAPACSPSGVNINPNIQPLAGAA